MEEDREEGELSGSDNETDVYNPIVRPDASIYRNCQPCDISEDESSESEDSDSDCPLPKRKKTRYQGPTPIPQPFYNQTAQNTNGRKKNNIWTNVLQEEGLMQDIHDVGLKKINSDRNVESYDYTQALKLHGKYESEEEEDETEVNMDKKDEEDDGEMKIITREKPYARLAFPDQSKRKRKREKHKKQKPRYLREILNDSEFTDEDLGNLIANALFEPKSEILVRCVEILGRSKALAIYDETREVEKEGGIMILNGSRRRTSGGVYFFLLKKFEDVTKEQTDKIFAEDAEKQQMEARQKRKAKRSIQRKESKESGNYDGIDEEGFHIRGLFTDDPGGTKCPGSTPVTTPQDSGSEDDSKRLSGFQSPPLPLKEVFARAALQIEERDSRSQSHSPELGLSTQEEMDIV